VTASSPFGELPRRAGHHLGSRVRVVQVIWPARLPFTCYASMGITMATSRMVTRQIQSWCGKSFFLAAGFEGRGLFETVRAWKTDDIS
jgi:hypothetical protein